MKSENPAQATWHTADGSAWWLRDTAHTQPNGDYSANCYMNLFGPPLNADSMTFDDGNCHFHSRSYYCQSKQTTTTTTAGPAPGPTPAPGANDKCVKITASSDATAPAALDVQISISKTGDPPIEVFQQVASGSHNPGAEVFKRCYTTPIYAIKVYNPTTDEWLGSVEFSRTGGTSWHFARCVGCTTELFYNATTNATTGIEHLKDTSKLLVDGDDVHTASTADISRCVNGEHCLIGAPQE